MKKLLFIGVLSFLIQVSSLWACDSCGCTLSKICENVNPFDQNKVWFFDFTAERQVWKTRAAEDANALVIEGHDVHDKTSEEFYHFTFGINPLDRLTVFTEMPYVVREALEVEDVDNLGRKQESEG